MFKSIVGMTLIGAIAFGIPVVAQGQANPSKFLAQGAETQQVSGEELQKFVAAVKQIEQIEYKAQEQMAQAVQQEGLTPERFIEIGNSIEGGENSNSKPSAEEQEKFSGALTKVKEIAQQAESQKQEVLVAQGFDLERFNQIVTQIQQDPTLKQQVQQMLQK